MTPTVAMLHPAILAGRNGNGWSRSHSWTKLPPRLACQNPGNKLYVGNVSVSAWEFSI
jgi:hypothetical protein